MGINNIKYEDMKKEYIASLNALKIKRNSHDAYLATKELEYINSAYNDYISLINEFINNTNLDNIDNSMDKLIGFADNISNKLISGFYDYSYLDEDKYSFNSYDEIINTLLKLHYEANSPDGILSRLAGINRLVLDLCRDIYTSDAVDKVVAEFSTAYKKLIM